VKVTVNITKSFSSAAKPLLKKHHSLSKDLLNLEKELTKTPWLGNYSLSSFFVIKNPVNKPRPARVKMVAG
jgi:hypothetical protein